MATDRERWGYCNSERTLVDEALADPDYLVWLTEQDDFDERFPNAARELAETCHAVGRGYMRVSKRFWREYQKTIDRIPVEHRDVEVFGEPRTPKRQ
jgi:hypothetical protein